ncbi:TPA: hypothetical protein I9Y37_001877 [Citrobacter freundii]|nr:hypothetical protein [Citrobacter freundii]HAT3963853.1 hypothetical protein [Citrobacter freundii]
MRFLKKTELTSTAVADLLCKFMEPVNQLHANDLPDALRTSGLNGLQLAAVWKYAPEWFLNETGREIAQVITNLTHPQQSGICYAKTDKIIDKAKTNQSAFERFMRKTGGKLFACQRRFNQSSLRTLTPAAIRFTLTTWQIVRASLPTAYTTALMERLTTIIFGVKPEEKKGRGRPKKCEGLKEPQNPITQKVKKCAAVNKFLAALRDALQKVRVAIRPERRNVPAWKRQPRDINQICQPDTKIPDGFRGAEPNEPAPTPAGHQLTPAEKMVLPYYLAHPENIPGPLLASYRKAGVWVEA